ncbi:MAG TPA: MFS transporter [Opitutaceae bacterium]|jgi:MFS family permease|nr:MFS transporter [Opitutaceae bacterium]
MPTAPTPVNESTVPRKTAAQLIVAYFKDFGVLRETGREYWGIQIVNFLDCTAYFAILTIASVFLSDDLGLSDKQAGYSVAAFTSAVTILLFVSGMFTDWLGIRKSLGISMVAQLMLRLAMVVVGLTPGLPHRGLLASALLLLMAPFMASIQTVFQASCQRYTTKRSRSAGFNLWYLFMNVGAAAGGFLIDVIRLKLHLADVHVFTLGVVTAALCLVVGATLVRREDQLVSPDDPPAEAKQEAVVEHKSPLRIMKEVVSEPTLWRLLVLIALTLGVRAVYAYMYLLMPKYWLRTIGPDAAFGTLNAINPVGIVIGLVLFIPLANKFNLFNMLVYGSMFSALSLFPLAVPWTFYGSNIVTAHYVMALLCMILLTIGEVAWSPKLYEYTAAIAPKGQEGTYLGLSMVPWFLAKTLVSVFSGHLLERWAPEKVLVNGTDVPLKEALLHNQVSYWNSPAAMWLILGVYAMIGCWGAVLLRDWLTRGARWKNAQPAT